MKPAIRHLQLILRERRQLESGITTLVLADQDDWRLPAFRPGAHIDIHLTNGMVRTYSLCNDPADCRRYVLAIKHEPQGRGGSAYIHNTLQEGDTVGVSVPRAGLDLIDDGMNVFIAGGIGITPFISAIRWLERRHKTNYVLHWLNKGVPGLQGMLHAALIGGRVHLHNTLDQPRPSLASLLEQHEATAKAFGCGPNTLLEDFESAVQNWPDDRKHIERFKPLKPAADPDARPYTVKLAKSGQERVVLPEVGLAATLQAMNADVSLSCEGGLCGSCRTRWLEGPPIHRDRVLSPHERETDVMVCVAGCKGPKLVLDL